VLHDRDAGPKRRLHPLVLGRGRGGDAVPLQGVVVGAEAGGRVECVDAREVLPGRVDALGADLELPEDVELATLGVIVEADELDEGRRAQAGAGVAVVCGGREDLADEVLALAGAHQLAGAREVAGIEVGLDPVQDAARQGVEGGPVGVGGRRGRVRGLAQGSARGSARYGGRRGRGPRGGVLGPLGLELERLVLGDAGGGGEDGTELILVAGAAGLERVALDHPAELVAVELGEQRRQPADGGERGGETVDADDAGQVDRHVVVLLEPAQHRGELPLIEQRDQPGDGGHGPGEDRREGLLPRLALGPRRAGWSGRRLRPRRRGCARSAPPSRR
jgi:hypothetical protein